ncbi:MAG: protein kinase [Deltaproteobacteria bacterium]|nr:protein kinase [Deltaproteobacteria bacterium]
MSASKPRLKEGDVFGDRYRIDGVVGKGGFGAVYRATDLQWGRSVALKVLLANYATSESDSKRFKREAALVKELEHPNIVTLINFGQTERGVPYIAFELLGGRALGQALEEDGPFDLDRTLRVGIDVLRALDVAHERGVIHRDIKPQNVFLLDGPPFTKVLDFGIAKAMKGEVSLSTKLTESGQMVGTPQYMAPEQVRGSGVYPSSDLYSLGLVLAEMLTAERVLRDESLINIYMAHISPQRLPMDPRVIDGPLGPVILRATNKDLAQRYGSAAEMRADLERIPQGSGLRLAAAGRGGFGTRSIPAVVDPASEPTGEPATSRTAPMAAVLEEHAVSQPSRGPRLAAGKTMVMEEVEEAPVSSSVASFAQLSGAVPAPASLANSGRDGFHGVSAARPSQPPSSGAHAPSAHSQDAQRAWGPYPEPFGAGPPAGFSAAPGGLPGAPGGLPAAPGGLLPVRRDQRGLKVALALVVVMLLGLVATAIALTR